MIYSASPQGYELVIIGWIAIVSTFFGSLPLGAFVRKFYSLSPAKTSQFKPQLKYVLSQGLDVLKGVLIIALVQGEGINLIHTFVYPGVEFSASLHFISAWVAGLFALIGHCYTPWKALREGKGVSLLLGIGFMLSPAAALLGISGAILAWMDERDSAVISITGIVLATVSHLILYPLQSCTWVGVFYLYVIFGQFESYIQFDLQSKSLKN